MKPNEFFKKRFGIIEESKNDEELMSNLLGCIAEDCGGCPYKTDACKTGLLMDVNNLIERQQAEIDRLNIDLKAMRGAANSWKAEVQRICKKEFDNIEIDIEAVKSEAVREFAERLKEHSCNLTEYDEGGWSDTVSAVKVEDIDRLLEGMGCNNG